MKKIKNIEIKQRLREIEKMDDYYAKVKSLCELSGVVAFYGHTNPDATQDQLKSTEKMAHDTIDMIIKRYSL